MQVDFSKYLAICPQISIKDHPPGDTAIRLQGKVGSMCRWSKCRCVGIIQAHTALAPASAHASVVCAFEAVIPLYCKRPTFNCVGVLLQTGMGRVRVALSLS